MVAVLLVVVGPAGPTTINNEPTNDLKHRDSTAENM
jgi:hypothetical protein